MNVGWLIRHIRTQMDERPSSGRDKWAHPSVPSPCGAIRQKKNKSVNEQEAGYGIWQKPSQRGDPPLWGRPSTQSSKGPTTKRPAPRKPGLEEHVSLEALHGYRSRRFLPADPAVRAAGRLSISTAGKKKVRCGPRVGDRQ